MAVFCRGREMTEEGGYYCTVMMEGCVPREWRWALCSDDGNFETVISEQHGWGWVRVGTIGSG